MISRRKPFSSFDVEEKRKKSFNFLSFHRKIFSMIKKVPAPSSRVFNDSLNFKTFTSVSYTNNSMFIHVKIVLQNKQTWYCSSHLYSQM